MKILVTGSAGFLGGYIVDELLSRGFEVIGIDNFSKYGPRQVTHDPRYHFHLGDCKDAWLMKKLMAGCDVVIAAAARIGGISYFHQYAYDLMAENDRIIAATYEAAIEEFKRGYLRRMVVVSSSMVFENATVFPTPESHVNECPPPSSTYGFQKLACEYYAKGAFEQYKLPYVIVRPFNCVGIGEVRAKNAPVVKSGDINLAMSHVIPDLCVKVLKRQTPLHVLGDGEQVRCYTYGADIATGIVQAMLHGYDNRDYNISSVEETKVVDLAEMIWRKCHKGTADFRIVCDEPFRYDVKKRVPDTTRAWLDFNFRALTPLDKSLDLIIPWIREKMSEGVL